MSNRRHEIREVMPPPNEASKSRDPDTLAASLHGTHRNIEFLDSAWEIVARTRHSWGDAEQNVETVVEVRMHERGPDRLVVAYEEYQETEGSRSPLRAWYVADDPVYSGNLETAVRNAAQTCGDAALKIELALLQKLPAHFLG